MNDAPERIWINECDYSQAVSEPAITGIEYTRADLHADLIKAADELAEVLRGGLQADAFTTYEDWERVAISDLAAYSKAKEKLK